MNSVQQGRVTLEKGVSDKLYPLFQEPSGSSTRSFKNEALQGNLIQTTPLSDLYFSQVNIDAVQQGIRYKVYVESKGKYVIGRQSDTELMTIMRSIYLQHAQHQPTNVVGQVKVLNSMVIEFSVPRILAELEQYNTYRKDITTLPVPMERAQNMSNKGSKFLFMRDL
jgi:hypothetical protein